jgi:hypothetical protein
MDLSAQTVLWNDLRRQLAEINGLAEDDPALFDTLDGEMDLADYLRRLVRKRRQLCADSDALRGMIKEMEERKLRLDNTAKNIGNAVVHAMSAAGMNRLPAPDFSVSIGYGKAPIVGAVEASELPDHLVRVERSINRTALREALDAGENIPGVYLGNPQPHLIVRKS